MIESLKCLCPIKKKGEQEYYFVKNKKKTVKRNLKKKLNKVKCDNSIFLLLVFVFLIKAL